MSIGPGVFVPVVGPSGSGKDSLMAHARRRLAGDRRFVFARRVVTRPCDPEAEPHDTLDERAFEQAAAAGAFALSWRSHGLRYGVPVGVDEAIRAGGVVVANLSRALVGEAAVRYARICPVLVRVSPDVLARRLASRGREGAQEIAARVARNAGYADFDVECRVIDNDGALDVAGERFAALLIDVADGRSYSTRAEMMRS